MIGLYTTTQNTLEGVLIKNTFKNGNTTGVCFAEDHLLAVPGKARGRSTNTIVINSFTVFFLWFLL